jgi:hypothetical protein
MVTEHLAKRSVNGRAPEAVERMIAFKKVTLRRSFPALTCFLIAANVACFGC